MQRGYLQDASTKYFTQKMTEALYRVAKIFYTILAAIGVFVNLMGIMVLSRGKCGLSTCTTRYLVAMAMADLLSIIMVVILWEISWYYFPWTFLHITPVCTSVAVLMSVAVDCSVWFTVTFSFDRFVAICCPKLKTKYCTKKSASVALAATCILLCLRNIPFSFIYEPWKVINNVPWYCDPKPSYYTDPGWVAFDLFDKIINPLIPFALILLVNALMVRHIVVTSRVRKELRSQIKGDNHFDPEMESRKKSMILVFTISGSFIILWLLSVIELIYHKIMQKDPEDYNDSEYILLQVSQMLRNLNSSTNAFIYGITQTKFRQQLNSAVKYPFTAIMRLMKK
ncbi:probable G-protein coupled receptor 139 [Stegostoma tigrinum]|uniref:probable G-protein coupled receptor 139 n=1 Tax=Stegostoma tigrinum TaxID=3053191 RepID=UPI00286FF0B6|nr:probable G-protein coupled receptor 139 [Stegostoma tigrinum]